MGPSVAEAAAAYLRQIGIRRVYGVPGEDHLDLLHRIEAEGIAYIPAREESAACIMAAAEAQARDLPGVVIVTIAPGLTGAVNGIASAYLDHIPLLIVSGQHSAERYPVTVRQTLDSHALLASITKWTVPASARINQVLARAVDTALAAPSGPVFVELRDDVARSESADAPLDWPSSLSPRDRIVPTYSGGSMTRVADMIEGSERPVVIVGSRVRDTAVGSAAADAAAALGLPILTTPSAMGIVPDDHPWLAGTFLNGNPESQIVGRADLMVTIGLEANDIFNASWRYRADVVALEADETNTSHFARVTYQAVGDLEALLTAVVEATAGYSSKWATADVTEYRQSLRSLFGSEDDRLTIPNAISDMRAAAPDESLVAVDAGFGKPLMSYLWRARRPNSYFSSQGLSTMGYALPAATALKLARPDWTVIGSMGDGSLHMRAAELGVAADQGAAPIFVTWVDGSLSQIEIKQRRRNLTPVGVSLPPRSCEKIAAAFGAVGYDVESRADFQAALKDAIERESMPSLIGVRVDNGDRERWFDALRG